MKLRPHRRPWILRFGVVALALCVLVVPASAEVPGPLPAAPAAAPELTLQVPVAQRPGGRAGSVFTAAPKDVAAPRATPVTLAEIRQDMEAGDVERALDTAHQFVATNPWGRDRDAAWLLIGMIERERDHHNAASEAFARVRAGNGPLAPWGAYYEAEQDLERGEAEVAVTECEAYDEHWPKGDHAEDCLRLTARAWASLGRSVAALAAAGEYDADHEDAPITEQIDLQLGEWEARNDPAAAVPRLQRLATHYTEPLTGRYAEELLGQLRAQGVKGAVLPDDVGSLEARALSLRDSGRRDAAWAAFEELTSRADDDPPLQRWLSGEAIPFASATRRWDVLVGLYRDEYQRYPTGDAAWEVYHALERAGRFSEASDIALGAEKDHGRTRRWKYAEDEVGHTMMLAHRYDDAMRQFDHVASRGGWIGRKGAWEAAFSSFMGGHDADAVKRFDAIIRQNRSYVVEAHYWRARALDQLARTDEADADRWWVLQHDPDSWYALLIHQRGDHPTRPPFARDGRWPGPALPDLRDYASEDPSTDPIPLAHIATVRPVKANPAFATLMWPMRTIQLPDTPPPPPLVMQDLWKPPASYRPGRFFDPGDAQTALAKFAQAYGKDWPILPAIADMVSVGLYDLTGPAFAEFYDDWDKALRFRSQPLHDVARSMDLSPDDWRTLFLVTRDHHHAARFTYGLDASQKDPVARAEARELAWPLAHGRYVWAHSRQQDVDPYLALAVMRAESTYASTATSHAGARGAMQIMPRTGHLLADLSHDTTFTAGDLEDPVVAVGYGLQYLGLLLDRFEGVYPLAVASYNGGPHNVSTWLGGTGNALPMDEWVEEIPFYETRNYVKKVSADYATYLALYTPKGTEIVLPSHPRGDDPSVVDF